MAAAKKAARKPAKRAATPAAPGRPAAPGSRAPAAAASSPGPSQDERTLGLAAHLLLIFTWWLGPLILWLVKKDQRGFAEHQAREALNFGITLTLAAVALAILSAILEAATLGVIPYDGLPGLVWVAGLVFGILAAVAANKGQAYAYPVSLRLVKEPGPAPAKP